MYAILVKHHSKCDTSREKENTPSKFVPSQRISTSNDPFDGISVQMQNENLDKEHFLARIFEDNSGVVRIATENIRGEDHREIVHVHFSHCGIFGCHEGLEATSVR